MLFSVQAKGPELATSVFTKGGIS